MDFTRRPSGKVRSVAEIGPDLYERYKALPTGARGTRGMVRMKIREIYHEYVGKCAPEGTGPSQFGGVSSKNRAHWLKAWCARYRVSFRAPNKKYAMA